MKTMIAIIFVCFVALFIWCCSVPDIRPCEPDSADPIEMYWLSKDTLRIDKVAQECQIWFNNDRQSPLCPGGHLGRVGVDVTARDGDMIYVKWVDRSCDAMGVIRQEVYRVSK